MAEEPGGRRYVEIEELMVPDSAGAFRIARVRELEPRSMGSAIAYRPGGDTLQVGGFDMFVYMPAMFDDIARRNYD